MSLTLLPMSRKEPDTQVAKSPSQTIEDIVVRLQGGDEAALQDFIERTERACYRLGLSILKDADLAKDAMQDAYLIVYQRIGQLREPGAVKTWLFRILTRCCHEIAKKRAREFGADVETREEADTQLVGVSQTPIRQPL